LGLDAPQKLDIRALYKTGDDELTAERIARRRVLEALPIEEQVRLYEIFETAKKRTAAGLFAEPIAIETPSRPQTRNAIRIDARSAEDAIDFDRVVLSNNLRLIRHAWHVVEPSKSG